jgi:hypothetical protein
MKTEDFGFRGNDVENIDGIIDALYELVCIISFQLFKIRFF